MGVEPALTVAVGGGLSGVEPVLDALPVALALIEPSSGRVLHANAAAQRLGGLALDGVIARIARGEIVRHELVDTGARTLLVSGGTLTLNGCEVSVMTFEDVSGLEADRRRATVLADELRLMLDGLADAVTVQGPDHRLVYANEAASRLFGITRGPAVGEFSAEHYVSQFDVIDDAGRPFALDHLPGRRALSGTEPEPLILRSRSRETGELRWTRIKSTSVRDADGTARLAINLVEDITELKRSEQSQRFLAEASRTLAGSLDTERTLAAVEELAVGTLAERCTVTLAREGAVPGPEAVEVMRGGSRLEPGRIDVPMAGSGRVLGTITLHAGPLRRYDEHDLLVAEDLGLRAGAALANARLYRAASRLARTLQTSLLPPHLPDVPGAALAAAYHPAGEGLEVGGDFYDVFSTGEGQWYLVMGDVCGKGAEAAAVTALARYTLRTAAARRRSPAAILRWVGAAMLDQDAAGGRFCTIACAHVDVTRRPARVTVSCGGHPLPIVRRAGGSVEEFGVPGTLLGLVSDPDLQDRSTDLRPGDALLLYTDGLTEARAPSTQWSAEELAAAVRAVPADTPQALVDGLLGAALGPRRAPRDDVALLALQLRA